MAKEDKIINTGIESSESTDIPFGGTPFDMPLPTNNSSNKILSNEICSYINLSVQTFISPIINTLKANVKDYKKECKNLQEKYENSLKDNSKLQGKVDTLEKFAAGIFVFLIVQIVGMLGAFFRYIQPNYTDCKVRIQSIQDNIEFMKKNNNSNNSNTSMNNKTTENPKNTITKL